MIKAERAEVFFVDTANASGAGAEDNQDMPKYSQALTTIITETRAAGMINHHTPLGNSTRERGHTSFRGMLDLSVVVTKKPDGTREISFGKARDGEEAPFGSYRIDVESLGTTNLGKPFTVPYLVELGVVQQTKEGAHRKAGDPRCASWKSGQKNFQGDPSRGLQAGSPWKFA